MTCTTISDANPDIAGIGIILAFAVQALISLALSITAKLLETPDLRHLLALEIQSARDIIDALCDTSVPASTRVKNAAVPYVQYLMNMSAGFISVSTRSSTTWEDLSSIIIKQYTNLANQVKDDIKITFRTGDEAEIVHHEATVDPTSKEAVRFARKQSLIC